MNWKKVIKPLVVGTVAGLLIYILTGSDSWIGFSILLFYLEIKGNGRNAEHKSANK